MRRLVAALVVAVTGAAMQSAAVTAGAAALSAPAVSPATTPALTNLAHLDFLATAVTPPARTGHTTYRLALEPSIGELWVYATHNADDSYTRVGGGTFHAATGTYDQGAYDADDVARAVVVYLRHWRLFGDAHSRSTAYELLRGLTYLQTASGPHAGNVVLWMQPDGALNPSALPKEEPDPSDSANSYWLARTIWALGEGYRAFVHHDRAFARFLRQRLDLAIHALDQDSLSRFGEYQSVDGARTPAWLIVDGADASAEAVLGLAAFVTAGGTEARGALRELSVGIAALGEAARPRDPAGAQWPYGAILPSATSRSSWHAWASNTPAALSNASSALHRPALADAAVADAAAFSPDLLASYGPVNGLLPTAVDRSEIAYGVDSRVQSLLATARVVHSAGLRQLAGMYAGWYFGQNPAGAPMYDPATGVTDDGVSADGVVNQNSGAESTIHGLLSMLALDAAPDVARIARESSTIVARSGTTTVEAESATVDGAAGPAAADPASTAESAWSAAQYLQVSGPARATWTVAASAEPRVLEAVLDRVPGRAARASFQGIGRVGFGGGGAQGSSAAPGELVPVVVGTVPPGTTSISARFTGGAGKLDALLLTPAISTLRTSHAILLTSRSAHLRSISLSTPALVSSYDSSGRLVEQRRAAEALVAPGGFTTVISPR